MFKGLMSSRRFAPLFWSQFFGALNDNLIKNALAIMVMFGIAGTQADHKAMLVTLAGVMLIMPFFLFSGVAGELADSRDKARVAVWVKGAEVGAALLALTGFVLGSVPLLMGTLFLTGTLSTLFGPIKYSVLPEHLRKDELVTGNALVEAGTFVAILLGTVVGGILGTPEPWMAGALAVCIAVMAFISTLKLPESPPKAVGLYVDPNILRSSLRLVRDLRLDQTAWGSSIAISWFWTVGAVTISLIPVLVSEFAGGSQSVATLFLSLFTVGIGIGSMLAAKLSAGRIVRTLVPVGAVLIGVFALDLAWTLEADKAAPGGDWSSYLLSGHGLHVSLSLLGLAASGGLFVVPAFAALQDESPSDKRARLIAGNNVLNAVFMVAGSVALMGAQKVGVPTKAVLATIGAANFVAVPLLAREMKAPLLRDAVFLFLRILFRVSVHGLNNLSHDRKPRVIVANHVSLLDAALMLSVLGKDVIFAIDTGIAQKWWVKPFLRNVRVFPIDPTRPMAMKTMTALVKEGETLVIFPEGRITVTGAPMKVYDGTAMVAIRAEAEIVPMWIDGLERSPFSYLKRSQVPKSLFPKVDLHVLPPTRLTVDPVLVGRTRRVAAGRCLQDVMTQARLSTFNTSRTVFESVIDAERKYGSGKVAVSDPMGARLSYRKLLAGAATLDRVLGGGLDNGGPIGIMLPNTAGVVAVMLAVMRRGRTPAMLNFTAGPANLVSACNTAEIRTVLTSRAFIEKARLERSLEAIQSVASVIMLEDVRARVTLRDKVLGLMTRHRHRKVSPDSAGVILFTSGSEGVPKGVVLSHSNILSNCAQVTSRFDFSMQDSIFNALPVFHSFGLTGGLILPLVTGLRTFMYPSPMHYKIIPELVYQERTTAIFGTDVLLNGYARKAHPYDLSSIRYVVAGAEKVRPETRAVWMEKFGLRILEGYGITEGAPVVAVNTPFDFRNGTVGRFVPGIEHRLDPVPGVEEGGQLFIRGPNIMKGYLKADSPGVLQPLEDGWHDTGDIVAVDSEGFVTIKGRKKRFAKLAGEMVSLAAVESYVAAAYPSDGHVAVSLPDPKKGERIVLMTTRKGLTRAELQAAAKQGGATELMVPSTIMHLDKLPLLGSGKVDFVEAQKIALASVDRPGDSIAGQIVQDALETA